MGSRSAGKSGGRKGGLNSVAILGTAKARSLERAHRHNPAALKTARPQASVCRYRMPVTGPGVKFSDS